MMRNPDRWIAGAGGLVSLVTLLSLWFSGVWHLGARMGALEAGIDGVERRLDGVGWHLDGVDARLLSIEEALRGGAAVSAPPAGDGHEPVERSGSTRLPGTDRLSWLVRSARESA